MKRLLLTLALAATAATATWAEDYTYLALNTASGSTVIARTQVRKLTFADGNVIIHQADGTTATQALSSLTSISFTSNPNAVRAIAQTAATLRMEGRRLVAAGEGMLLIYDAQGRTVRQASVDGSRAEFGTDDLSRGLYIARLGNTTLKFVR